MFKVIWEKGNLIRLVESADEKIELNAPRIVYADELRILGVDKYLYPAQNVPVCWCCERKYYYNGILETILHYSLFLFVFFVFFWKTEKSQKGM